ncbi:WD repeat-containing protein 78-like [Cyclopterus lumpus]|uniref:WD repeat-containing protein 78-like n=1 Tax=Cyclopterus lumpus TaxID=8103 RepID=UPI0014870852|nr:WD repeat-containing protein 78-like [Cyclopterus lumpus]
MKKHSQLLHSLRTPSSSVTQSRSSSLSVGGSKKNKKRITNQAPKKEVKVLNKDGKDVTPLLLYRAEPGEESQPGRYFLDEVFTSSGSDHSRSPSSSNVHSYSSFVGNSQLYTATESKDSVLELDMPINHPATSEVPRKRDNVKEDVTEEMLDEEVNICLSETDTISLLDIPSTLMSEDADDVEAIKARNVQYAELCKNRMGNDKYVARSTQTFNGTPKSKPTQTYNISAVDEETMASVCDIHDSLENQIKTLESGEETEYPEATVNTSKDQENIRRSSSCSTICTGSTCSLQLAMETCENSGTADSDLQLIMLSESFKYSLFVMERSIMANTFQTKLAAYKQLPTLEDPDSTVKPGTKEQGEEGSSSPMLEYFLDFSCELTRGCNITSMAWNKKNPDILAVGYGDFDSKNQQPSLICCWCLKNPTWPERIIHCHSCVISLDFSANNPSQLAVGMDDGTMAIYDVSRCDSTCIADSSKCFKRHLHPVWQVNWIKEGMASSGQERAEALISVSADGRISKWFLCSDGLDCLVLMKLKKENAENKKTDHVLSVLLNPGLCVDFHPADSSIYVVGTWEGPIHKGCVSNNKHFLETYQQHSCPVNGIEWSPFNSYVFLSCSSDWTIQLWRKDLFIPVLSFTSTQRDVLGVKWSPNWSTVFAAHNGEQVEIWDMNASIIYPLIVHQAPAGVKVKSLLFTTGIDCVLVGDSDGQVTVYQIKNLSVGEDKKEADSLEDIINSAGSFEKSDSGKNHAGLPKKSPSVQIPVPSESRCHAAGDPRTYCWALLEGKEAQENQDQDRAGQTVQTLLQ